MDTLPQVAPAIYAPGEVLRMVSGQANALLAQLGACGALDVQGVLGPVRESRYPVHFGVELRDVGGGGDPLLLDIPKGLKPEDFVGREIKVRGFLQAKKGLVVALQVTRLRLVDQVSPEVLREEKSLRDILGKPNRGQDTFPCLADLAVSCIHGLNSQVLADFRNQVAAIGGLELESVPANLLEPAAIADAIRAARGSVVVLMRGGGKGTRVILKCSNSPWSWRPGGPSMRSR